jgi:two-component system, NarL family, nitrate/nitrite response regulator NarL
MADTIDTIRVVLLDDHRCVIWGLEQLIESQEPRMRVVGRFTSFSDASIHIEALNANVILLDLDLGDEQGIDIIPKLMLISDAKILILTGTRDAGLHDKAIIAGAKGILQKENSAESILTAIEQVHSGHLWIDEAQMSRLLQPASPTTSNHEHNPEERKISSLTSRELQIIKAVTTRASISGNNVAREMHISESTLRNHLTSIYSKLELSNRLELWDYAHKYGLNKDSQ